MATKKPGLGRSLEALLSASQPVSGSASTDVVTNLLELAVTQLSPGKYQPRQHISEVELETLSESIRSQGVIQPIIVRLISKDKYEIIAGERRWRAAQLAGLTTIPVVIKDVPDEKAMIIALIENIQRENLNPLEEAQALERLAKEFDLTHIQVADAVGKSRAAVTNLLRLLGLTEEVKQYLEKGQIEVGHAKVLLGLKTHQQSTIAKTIIAKGLSVRETERLVAGLLERDPSKPRRAQSLDPDIRRLQNSLSEKLGAVVELHHGLQGRGKLIIQYNSLEELDGILEHIQ